MQLPTTLALLCPAFFYFVVPNENSTFLSLKTSASLENCVIRND
jgi:hypothetical protein